MMYNTLKPHLQYVQKELLFNSKSLQFLKNNYQGPCYVYDLDFIGHRYQTLAHFLPQSEIYYAIKANPDLRILKKLQELGCGADVVSGGEIMRVLEAGFSPDKIIFSGVAKTFREIELAITRQIAQINVESLPELLRVCEVAQRLGQPMAVVLRINPDIEVQTHKYIATGFRENKFGIEIESLPEAIQILRGQKLVKLVGLSLHLGSQIKEFSGFKQALQKAKQIFSNLKSQGFPCDRFDFGGGLGILYEEINPQKEFELLKEYSEVVSSELSDLASLGVRLQTEPGRWIVGHGGILVCQVQYIKKTPYKNFLIIDSGMNHLLRPTLYEAYHWIAPIEKKSDKMIEFDVVGPICESSDFFAKARLFPEVSPLDLIVVADVGAYGASMSSDYNLQDRAQEILI